jgi:hypothetical protein
MKRMFFIAAALCLLTACSTWTKLTEATVSPTTVVVAVNAFDAAKATATNYITYCTPNPAPVGCSESAIVKLIPAVRSGTEARNSLKDFLKTHPGQLGEKGVYDALTSATSTIQAIAAQYNLKGN